MTQMFSLSLPVTTLTTMGWIADFKLRRAAKAAQKLNEQQMSIWQEDANTLEKLITVFTAASKGEDAISNTLTQKAGEHTLWSASGIFHEAGRTPSQYVGGSSGVSIPVGGGIRFRVGAMRGQVIPGEELQIDKDQGVVMLTTDRLIFTGPIKTQQWDFDKLLMASCTDDESDYFLSVSNRQKTSGVKFEPQIGREFNRFLGCAIIVNEKGYVAVLDELISLKKELAREKEKFISGGVNSSNSNFS